MGNDTTKFRSGVFIAVIGAVFGALITIIGQPYVNQLFEEAKTPKLTKDVRSTNINQLPPEVKNQISLVTSRYSIQHISGGTAENLTIDIVTSEDIPLANLVVDPSSEPHQIDAINGNRFKIEVPSIRPGGLISYEITHSPNISIESSEIIGQGEIDVFQWSGSVSGMEWYQYLLLAAFIILWIVIIYIAWRALNRAAQHFVSLEATGTEDRKNSKLASILVGLVSFNFISRMDLGIIDLPSIPIGDMFYALLIYIIVTNYTALKKSIRAE